MLRRSILCGPMKMTRISCLMILVYKQSRFLSSCQNLMHRFCIVLSELAPQLRRDAAFYYWNVNVQCICLRTVRSWCLLSHLIPYKIKICWLFSVGYLLLVTAGGWPPVLLLWIIWPRCWHHRPSCAKHAWSWCRMKLEWKITAMSWYVYSWEEELIEVSMPPLL